MKKATLTLLMLVALSYLSSANFKDMGKLVDLTGKTFGRLTVISRQETDSRRAYWLCRCFCGTLKVICGKHLACGKIKTCGCVHPRLKHNHAAGSGTREYSSWEHMKGRCNNLKHRKYNYYGGRGISVCDRWVNSFENFLADMGHAPSQKHTLDRIKSSGNYEPNNCRWATNEEQQNNKRNTVIVSYNGENRALKPLCDELGLSRDIVGRRLLSGWPLLKALNHPVRFKSKTL